jgi:hypothetical protein
MILTVIEKINKGRTHKAGNKMGRKLIFPFQLLSQDHVKNGSAYFRENGIF